MSRKEIGYDLNGNNKIKMFKDIDLNFAELYNRENGIVVFPEDFGTIGEGDDTLAIQAAIASISDNYSALGGVTIFFDNKTYITEGLKMAPGVIIKGKSVFGSKIKLKDNTDDVMFQMNSCAGAGFSTITLDGSRTTQTAQIGTSTQVPTTLAKAEYHCLNIFRDITSPPENGSDYITNNNRLLVFDNVNITGFAGNGINIDDTDAWIFTIKDTRIVGNDGWGIWNNSNDNRFYNIDINQCEKGAVYNSGADNKFFGGKWMGNAEANKGTAGNSDDNTGGSVTETGGRTLYLGVEVQDNFGHGLLVDGAYLASFVGCLFDTAGYTDSVTTDRNMIKINRAKSINFAGCIVACYISDVQVLNAMRVQSSSGIRMDIKMRNQADSMHVERILSTDGSDVIVNSDIRDGFEKVSTDYSNAGTPALLVDRWVKLARIYVVLDDRDVEWSTQVLFHKTKSIANLYGTFDMDAGKNVTGAKFKLESKVSNESLEDLKARFTVNYYTDGSDNRYIDIWVYSELGDVVWRKDFRVHSKDERLIQHELYDYRFNDWFGTTLSEITVPISGYTVIPTETDTISASEGITPGTLIPGEIVTENTTVAGVVLGDFADASFSLDPKGVTITSDVVGEGTVKTTFQNNTNADITLGFGSINIRVIKL